MNSHKNLASFDTLVDPEAAKVVEIKIISKFVSFAMILRSNTPMCLEVMGVLRDKGDKALGHHEIDN